MPSTFEARSVTHFVCFISDIFRVVRLATAETERRIGSIES